MSSEKIKSLDMLNAVSVRGAIDRIMKDESKNLPVARVCEAFRKRLDSGESDAMLCEEFITELSKVANYNTSKNVLSDVIASRNIYKRDIDAICEALALRKGSFTYIAPSLENVLVEYMSDKTDDNREAVKEMLKLFGESTHTKAINEYLDFERFTKMSGNRIYNVPLLEAAEKTYTQAEVDKLVTEKVSDARKNERIKIEEEAKAAKPHRKIGDVDTHIHIHESIKKITSDKFCNENVKAFCDKYEQMLNSGKSNEMLVEDFISGLSNWNYLSAVDTEMSALKDRVSKYRQEIDLKKILEVMKVTTSYYIVPLIEDCVVDYLDNKTMNNRAFLLNRLNNFEFDPYVRDIIQAIRKDDSIAVNVNLGESIETPNLKVHTEEVFSPIQMLDESACVFNVKGAYYIKDKRGINKMRRSDTLTLSESFRNLCNLINSHSVDIVGSEIRLYSDENQAKIDECAITLNGTPVIPSELHNICENMISLNNDRKFYEGLEMLVENYDAIAPVDFVKRVASNDKSGRAVDVFKIKNDIYVNTVNESGESTFYRNVNPIQCREYINRHMDLNIAPLFEDVLPDQKTVEKSVKETSNAYEDRIKELESKKEELLSMKNECSEDESEEDKKDIEDAIKMVDDEIENTKKDYKEYQDKMDTELNGKKDDDKEDDAEGKDTSDTGDNGDNDNADGNGDDAGTGSSTSDDENGHETADQMEQPIGSAGNDTSMTDAGTTDAGATDAGASDMGGDSTGDNFDFGNFGSDDNSGTQNNIDNATEFDGTFDTVQDTDDESAFQVVKVTYKQNVKTGKKTGEGDVFIIIPTVNSNGDIYNENKKVTFYLDPNREPVINNEDMPLAMYYAIQNAIKNNADTQSVELMNGTGNPRSDGENTDVPVSTDNQGADSMSMSSVTTGGNNDFGDLLKGFGDDFGESGNQSSSSVAQTPVEEPAPSAAPATSQPAAQQDTPAETQEKGEETAQYPIDIDLNSNEIKPIKKEAFEAALDRMGIRRFQKEGAAPTKISFTVGNKAEAHALRDYFNEWHGWKTNNFCNFFPELKNCFNNSSSTLDIMGEGVQIEGIHGRTDSKLYEQDAHGRVTILIPNTAAYRRLLGINESSKGRTIRISTADVKETKQLYETLSGYAYEVGYDKLDEDVASFIEEYKDDFKDIYENYNVDIIKVPYNNFLMQKLMAKGLHVTESDEHMLISIRNADRKKVMKLFEQFYGKKKPLTVKSFFADMINEGVTITVKDDTTGKTVEINTDSLNGGSKPAEVTEPDNSAVDFNKAFNNDVTFDTSTSTLYGSDDKDSDEGEDKDKDKKNESEGENNSDNNGENGGDEPKEKKKHKFHFKKKEESDTNESVNSKTVEDILNEAEVNVYDTVRLKSNGKKGQVLSKFPNGNFIVNIEGHTFECASSDIALAVAKPDTEVPYKFDPVTLKALYEQMVQCGMFMNGMRVTPSNCYVKYSEYANANDNDEINLVIEGEATKVARRYVRVTENMDRFADAYNYVDATYLSEAGPIDVRVNKTDLMSNSCRALFKVNEDYTLKYVSTDRVTLKDTETK